MKERTRSPISVGSAYVDTVIQTPAPRFPASLPPRPPADGSPAREKQRQPVVTNRHHIVSSRSKPSRFGAPFCVHKLIRIALAGWPPLVALSGKFAGKRNRNQDLAIAAYPGAAQSVLGLIPCEACGRPAAASAKGVSFLSGHTAGPVKAGLALPPCTAIGESPLQVIS